MNPIKDFIVRVPRKYKDEVSFNGETLKLVSKFNEFEHRHNFAEIVGCPVDCPLENCEGAILYFHHHVIMEQKYDIGEDLYMVTYDPDGGYGNHAIAIEGEDGDITMLGDWCFVAPPPAAEEEATDSGIVLSLKEAPELEGELLHLPKDTDWLGAESGDVVGYRKNSEYEMELKDGSKVYRMRLSELMYAKEE